MSIRIGVKKAFKRAQQRNWLDAFTVLRQEVEREVVSPTSVVLDNGTSSDAVSDMQTLLDGNTYDISEAAGAPGIRMTATFASVTEVYGLFIRAYYSGSTTHYLEVQLYNYTAETWDTFLTIENSNGFNLRYVRIPDGSSYENAGEAKVRLEHPVSGNASHDAYVDYIGIER